jgi:replication factor C large subunit
MGDLFPDKYFPKDFDEFIGNVEVVETAKKWAEEWQNGKNQKPLLFFGSPGIGKTCLAYLIASKMNWQIFEMNSSDLRNKDSIEKIAGAATGNASLFGTKRLILIDEVDAMQGADRGGAGALAAIIKTANNPIIFTANDIYKNRNLVSLRSLTELKEFRKINYLSIAKRLRAICDKEEIEYDEDAVKELAKNSGGDFRSALLDTQSLSPKITKENVGELFPRQRKEKIFPVMTKIFKSHDMWGIKQMVDNTEVSSDLLLRWVEENIPRQFDEIDSAKAFDILSRGDIFQGRIYRRQHYAFLKYVYFLSTVGVGLSRSKDYHGWKPFQFPNLLSSLSASTAKRKQRKVTAGKIGKKTHTSIRHGMQDLPFIALLLKNKTMAPQLTNYFEFDEKDLAFLLITKKDTKKVQNLLAQSAEIEKQIILEKSQPKQSKLFG